jgi:hypothetical protein
MDTAPTYTKRYDIPMNFKPTRTKYKDILPNKSIKYNTEIIGFLEVIINIPDTIDIAIIIYKNIGLNPPKWSDIKKILYIVL